MNGNGNGVVKTALASAVSALVGAVAALAFVALSFGPRISTLEHEAKKGERWTRENQMEYMQAQNATHQMLAARLATMEAQIRMICKATDAGC